MVHECVCAALVSVDKAAKSIWFSGSDKAARIVATTGKH